MITHGQLSGMVPPFDCDYCGNVFDDYKAFTNHRQLHLDLPKFQCLECERVVKRKQVLRIHMRVHVSSTIIIFYTDFYGLIYLFVGSADKEKKNPSNTL